MNESEKVTNTDIMSIYQKSDNILIDIQNILETSQRQAYRVVNVFLIFSTQCVENIKDYFLGRIIDA